MISLISEMTDSKGRHARGWLFYDADCKFCTRLGTRLASPMRRRGLDIAPLQDPRVALLLGLSRDELLRAIRFVDVHGQSYSGADALLALASEFWWAQPLVWVARQPGVLAVMRSAYRRLAQRVSCNARQTDGSAKCFHFAL